MGANVESGWINSEHVVFPLYANVSAILTNQLQCVWERGEISALGFGAYCCVHLRESYAWRLRDGL